MTEEGLTPEEFSRLVALPENDPERVRAGSRPDFEARLRLYREFESPEAPPVPPAASAAAARTVTARVLAEVRPSHPAGRSWLAPLVRFFEQPAPRAALAFGALFVVVGTAFWFTTRLESPDPGAVRGEPESMFTIAEPRSFPDRVELSWPAVPGAEAYRVVFYGPDLNETARVEDLHVTTLGLDRRALPKGLEPGIEVLAEVTALAGGDAIAKSPARLVSLK
jgi:hypothetical protein